MSPLDRMAPVAVSGSLAGMRPRPDPSTCAARRARVGERLEGGALVLYGGNPSVRSNDTEFRFRPSSDFYYLTGLAEPGAVMVLRPGHTPAFTLFVRPRDREAEVWAGPRLGPERAAEWFGADAAHSLSELSKHLPELLDGARVIHTPLGQTALERPILRAIRMLMRRNREGAEPPIGIVDARVVMGEERLVKDAAALASLRRAIDVSADAHLEVMRRVRSGLWEFEIEALLEYAFRRNGASGPGYGTIVGAGERATILHYVDNDGPLVDGELLLVDAGAEWDLLSADITRTMPISGRFTPAQRDVYAIVLEANRTGIGLATVGSDIQKIHEACLRVLVEGLRGLGLVAETVDEAVEKGTYKTYYPHRTSHWLGADVHDVGDYSVARKPRPLAPGYVLTVEPGLYVPADDEKAPAELRGIGVRIEDDVLVREQGPEVLTHRVPKAIEAIEAIVGSGGSGSTSPMERAVVGSRRFQR